MTITLPIPLAVAILLAGFVAYIASLLCVYSIVENTSK